jgi:hypothetical protein
MLLYSSLQQYFQQNIRVQADGLSLNKGLGRYLQSYTEKPNIPVPTGHEDRGNNTTHVLNSIANNEKGSAAFVSVHQAMKAY